MYCRAIGARETRTLSLWRFSFSDKLSGLHESHGAVRKILRFCETLFCWAAPEAHCCIYLRCCVLTDCALVMIMMNGEIFISKFILLKSGMRTILDRGCFEWINQNQTHGGRRWENNRCSFINIRCWLEADTLYKRFKLPVNICYLLFWKSTWSQVSKYEKLISVLQCTLNHWCRNPPFNIYRAK